MSIPSFTRYPGPTRQTPPHARLLAAIGVLVMLGACTSMQDIPAGTPLSEVQARYGAPTVECPLADGNRRLIWSTQPMGQYAWSTQVSPDGTVGPVEQILTDANFSQVEAGSWGRDELHCTFGPPAETTIVGLPGSREVVWSYRYRQAGAWNSLMHFYFSNDTGKVDRKHPGPDPLYEPPEWNIF